MTFQSPSGATETRKLAHVEESLANIREALLALRYGSISITIHEDRIVQIDVTEKKRLKAG
jgi:hypothetical protein